MKKAVVAFLLLSAVVGAALICLKLSRPAPRAMDLLPESTLVFIDIPDFSKSRADFAKTELYALAQEPEVQAFLEKPLAALHEASSLAGTPRDAESIGNFILNGMQGEVFLALTHVTIVPFDVGLILGMDVRHKRIEATAGIYRLESALKQTYPHGNFQEKNYLGVKYSVWETQPGFLVCHAFFDSLAVFTLGEDTMRDTIACYTGQAPPDFKRLATSAKFQNVRQHASKNHEFLAYLNVEEMLNLVGPLLALAPQTSGMYQKFERIQTSAYSMTFVDRGVEDVGFLAYSGGPQPAPSPTQRKTLALTSPDTLLYSVGSADLTAIYEQGMQTLSQSGVASVMLAVEQFQQAQRSRGLHIREEILLRLGPELGIIANWRAGALVPDCAVVSEVTDPDKLRPALDGAMNALKESALGGDDQFPWDETESAGQKTSHHSHRRRSPRADVHDDGPVPHPGHHARLRARIAGPGERVKADPGHEPCVSAIHETTANEWVFLWLCRPPWIVRTPVWPGENRLVANWGQRVCRQEQTSANGNHCQAPVPVRFRDRERTTTGNLHVVFPVRQIHGSSGRSWWGDLGREHIRVPVEPGRYANLAQKVFK